jgi:hypothetical protein
VRTNHFLSPALQELAPTHAENRGTYDRYARARELAMRRKGENSVHDLVRILSDHVEPPAESICRHPGDGAGQIHAATVICPQERTMYTLFGNPCEGHAGRRPAGRITRPAYKERGSREVIAAGQQVADLPG